MRLVSPTGCNSEKHRVGTRNLESELAGAYFTRRLVSPTGCNSEKHRVGTRNLESELVGAYAGACREISKVSWLGLVSPTGCNSEKYSVGTRSHESKLTGPAEKPLQAR